MKTYIDYLFKSLAVLILILVSISCNEEEWLEENPLDFYSPENSYITQDDFNSAVARLYQGVDEAFYTVYTSEGRAMHYPTDVAIDAIDLTHALNSYKDKLFPNTSQVQNMWRRLYRIVFDANVIVERIDSEVVEINSEEDRNELKAEATFIRAFVYRSLTILYGGVPLILEEITSPKRDFTRATRDAVLDQCISDLDFASKNLPDVTNVKEEGRLCKAAAFHLLTEVYLMKQEWDNAISAATTVIDNSNFSLMTERFGTRKDEPGDVYWDLFRRDNQNRSSGNTEGIWVNQFEYLVEGGGTSTGWPRFLAPLYWQLKDTDGVNLFIGPSNHNGGRGIGWYAPTHYMRTEIWDDYDNDMRNSQYNIIRDIKADNPESQYYGQYIVASGAIDDFPNKLDRWWNMLFVKTIPINNWPDEYILDPETGLTTNSANETMTEDYIFRLAETYLLRAEAYLGKGDQANAAANINIVRARVNAAPVSAADVDIDYILDERARELCWEELRLLTLMRLGKLVERVRKYNHLTLDNILDHQNLWPIPAREIETNTEAELTQNPGYF
ncbi:MAG: RagB/SusD family nutrient uptake outer membrane protein [Cytophagales bacterium]|nr:RagB/SusD family nutrient uptake outer membrane protein [Cytophagales bacterium]